jgi:chromosome segregation ATPase
MANREIKTKVAIDGEKEYKESLKSINSALGTLKSELKLVESQYAGQANSYAALSAKGDVLSRMYDQQKEKVKAAAEQLEKAKKAQSDYAEKVSSAQSEISRCEAALAALGDASDLRSKPNSRRSSKRQRASSRRLKRGTSLRLAPSIPIRHR